MKYLLTSGGITNPSIRAALTGLLRKPIAECHALCIPTAMYGHPWVGPGRLAWEFIAGRSEDGMVGLGWSSVGVLELTALPSLEEDLWLPKVRAADVLLVSGGDALYLSHWVRRSGLAAHLPSLTDTVWVGLSAGSMVMAPRIGQEFVGWQPETGDDSALGLVGFSMFPHLDHPDLPTNTMAAAERWAARLPNPSYVIDDATAIVVDGPSVEVVSEGNWRLIPAPG
ncbi:MAG: type 1 glutamine amidotransferase-like domain-containing protein [Deinococcales bacterium]|nr:type 1 glutamine amidotransferase-like domain-containing protein [Deinococcales bacterium]